MRETAAFCGPLTELTFPHSSGVSQGLLGVMMGKPLNHESKAPWRFRVYHEMLLAYYPEKMSENGSYYFSFYVLHLHCGFRAFSSRQCGDLSHNHPAVCQQFLKTLSHCIFICSFLSSSATPTGCQILQPCYMYC